MSVNSYLQNLATNLVLSENERTRINTSIDTLIRRLSCFSFQEDIMEQLIFGSYTRGTILPRKYDDNSDVDFLVVFNHDQTRGYKPQTYLNWLKEFVETYYSFSEIYQSSPTIVLELHHVKIELVPGWISFYGNYYIPQGPSEWQTTQIRGDDQRLIENNKRNDYKIKPVIRLIKLWNVSNNNHRLKSYLIEKAITDTYFYCCTSYTDYLLFAMKALANAFYENRTILNNVVDEINDALEKESNGYPITAENTIKRLFPE